MHKQISANLSKKSNRDYIVGLRPYLIPCFSDKFVTCIDYEQLKHFPKWRADEMGREAMVSASNTYNSTLKRRL